MTTHSHTQTQRPLDQTQLTSKALTERADLPINSVKKHDTVTHNKRERERVAQLSLRKPHLTSTKTSNYSLAS